MIWSSSSDLERPKEHGNLEDDVNPEIDHRNGETEYIRFVNLDKPFDNVNRNNIFEVLEN